MVEAVWGQVKTEVNSLRESIQHIENFVKSVLEEIIKPYAIGVVSSVGGVLACLLLILIVFLCGFIQIRVKKSSKLS